MLRQLRYASNAFLSLVAPSSCWVSGDPVADADRSLSPAYRQQIAQQMIMPFCPNCGATVGPYTRFDHDNPCQECERRKLGVSSIVRVSAYTEPLSTLITRLKFNRRFEIAEILGVYLHQAIATHTHDGKNPPVDALIPIPLHWWRHWMRGFNQTEEIVRIASGHGHWPMLKPLWRVRATAPQTASPSRTARMTNVQNVFWCPQTKQLAGKHVWLVDDVCTTGATIRAAVRAIRKLPKEQQPASIHAAVVAITDHDAAETLPEMENKE